MKRQKKIPRFANEDEEREFWATHDSTDYIDWSSARPISFKDDNFKGTLRLIPEALRRVRKTAGFRQVDIARRSGLSKAMVSAYESGKSMPSLPSLTAYLGAIGRNLADLQNVVDELLGFRGTEKLELVVGRAVLRTLRAMDEGRRFVPSRSRTNEEVGGDK
jgi:transcriptional regulator with XRE-family HTH domain